MKEIKQKRKLPCPCQVGKFKCKYCMRDADWVNLKDRDIMDGKAYSSEGYWKLASEGICNKFESTDEQFKRRGGMFICSCPEKCDFYESKKSHKQE